MQDGALASHVDGQSIYRATDKDADHGSISGDLQNTKEQKGDDYPKQPIVPFPASGGLMWEYCQIKVGRFWKRKTTTMGMNQHS